jgi:hypothetical protein
VPIDDEQVIQVRLKDLEVRNARQWGGCWLVCALYEQLGLCAGLGGAGGVYIDSGLIAVLYLSSLVQTSVWPKSTDFTNATTLLLIARDESSDLFLGMRSSAIRTGCVDFILTPWRHCAEANKDQPSSLTLEGQVPIAGSIVDSLSGAMLGVGTNHIPATLV